ncbi:MAG: TRAP transporter TatT component family protein [Candidatus Thiodiazotropha sp.]
MFDLFPAIDQGRSSWISRTIRLPILLLSVCLAGCVSMATERLANNLSLAMLNQTDPEIVRSGAPAYLLLIDSLITQSPENRDLLYAGARLYGAYAGGLVSEPRRKQGLTDQSLAYARRGLCPETPELCHAMGESFTTFTDSLAQTDEVGRRHFEAAVTFSHGRDLMAKVEYARHYARLVFDRSLHDRLLNEVLQADPVADGLTLSNVMAQQQAGELLQDDYF